MNATMTDRSNVEFSEQRLAALHSIDILQPLTDEDLQQALAGMQIRQLAGGDVLLHEGDQTRLLFLTLSGSLDILQPVGDGHLQKTYTMKAGSSFGEVTLLAGIASAVGIRAAEPTEIAELSEEHFWSLMTSFAAVREAVLRNMSLRLAKRQSATFQQEKMASLGTMAAGLMHELNNPGSAARRASSQLRENLMRMHELTARWARREMVPAQKECMYELQEHTLRARAKTQLSSLEQGDAEEQLAEWLDEAGVRGAWKLAPTFVAVGIEVNDLQCARHTFEGDELSDALSWVEAMVSSMLLVGTIEESIGRVTELVHAVKSYAYEGRGQKQSIDINQSIHATLVVLGHKLREKQITVEKVMAPDLPTLETGCHGLNQIWTNLLDNSIDAAAQGGHISIKTWAEQVEGKKADLCILIKDDGAGIPLECQTAIFDPFFTTKPVGVGTGLGLGIAYKIVEACNGTIRFSSAPGDTEFAVRLPSTS